MKKRFAENKKGFSLVEVLIAIALLGVGGTAIVMMLGNSYQSSQAASDRSEAAFLASQTYEAVRSIGQDAYNRLIDNTYGLDDSSGTWNFTATADTLGRYTRQVVIETAKRDGLGDISDIGSNDIHTKKVTTTLTWEYLGASKILEFINYFTNWDSVNLFDDSDSDFSAGSHSGTEAIVNSDGEIALSGTMTYSFDCAEIVSIIDLEDVGTDGEIAYDVFIKNGIAYIVSDKDDDAGTMLSAWDMSDPENPAFLDDVEVDNSADPVRVVVHGGYAYVGMDTGSSEVRIYDAQNPNSLSAHSTLNISGNGEILDMHLDSANDRIFLSTESNGSEDEILIYDVSTPGSMSKIGGQEMGENIYGIFAINNYMYTAHLDGSTTILEVFDITTPNSPSSTDTIDLQESREVNDVVVANGYAYVARDGHNNRDELFIVDVTDPNNISIASQYDLLDENNTQIHDMFIDGASKRLFIAYEENGSTEGRILNVSNPASVYMANGFEFDVSAFGVHVEDDLALFAVDGPENSGGEVHVAQSDAPSCETGIYQQDPDDDGIVSIEAENHHNNLSQGGDTWTLTTSPSGYSGAGFMQALPDNGDSHATNYSFDSPRLDYNIDFVKTGTHYVWVRGRKSGGSNDSVHAGLNNTEISSADKISNFSSNNQWLWTSTTSDGGSRATLNVTATGDHQFNMWMHEDGFRLDKILLTINENYTPSGSGPAESQEEEEGGGGGSGSGGYTTSGEYISDIVNAGSASNWNTIEWTEDLITCPGSDIHVQIRTAATSGGLSSELWQGPDGEDADETDYFTNPAGELLSTDFNGDQYMQYKVLLTGPGTCSPYLEDILITYTPY